LSRSGEALATISARRGTEPAKLGQVLRGELDWIAMKALEKDRTRRYETANGLARDVERYLGYGNDSRQDGHSGVKVGWDSDLRWPVAGPQE
jgi:hypothetical protein